MRTLNRIKTDAEYMAEGFTAEEVPLIREHDELYNQYTIESKWGTLEDDDRLYWLIETLGI